MCRHCARERNAGVPRSVLITSNPVICACTICCAQHEITILATGPLTNLADAERARPGVLKLAKRIIIMGGAVSNEGNITPLAEFNFAFDP
jgi:inosine-uridine nucleoside N-ribohydrolase